jgi:hypothetical protein
LIKYPQADDQRFARPGSPGARARHVSCSKSYSSRSNRSIEPLPFGGQLSGEGLRTGRAGLVMLDFGVRELLQRVGFGSRGEAQCPAYVRRGAGLGAFTGEDPSFELTVMQAVDDVGFIADLKCSKHCITQFLEFGMAAVWLEGDGPGRGA